MFNFSTFNSHQISKLEICENFGSRLGARICLSQSEAQNREGIGSGSGVDPLLICSQSHVICLSQSEAQNREGIRADWEQIGRGLGGDPFLRGDLLPKLM